MKFRSLIFSLALAALPIVAMADMTDTQILEYIVKEQAKGTSQNDIAQQLMKKGVSVKQLQRVKEKYGKAANGGANGGLAGMTTGSRTRTNNGTNVSTAAGMGRVKGTPARNGRIDQENPDFMQMEGMLGEMYPDSTMMYMQMEVGPKVFGRDIFRNESISFEPNMNVATPSSYVLGTGDVVFIDVYGASQTSIEAEINPDGKIVVEDFGPIPLAGLSVDAAAKRVKSKLSKVYSDSEISLSLGQTRSIQVNVFGEVAVPGTYTLSAFASIFHALYYAGGVSDIGSLREVKLYRNGKLKSTFDLYDYILNGQMTGSIRLQDNDAIVVSPYLALVNISGKAKRPMYYEMKPTETIGQALQYAGGFASDAYTKSMRLVRKSGGSYSVHNITEDNMNSFLVADGDSLAIDSVVTRFNNMVEVKGAVFHPGMYELGKEVKSVKSLIDYAAGLTESAMSNRAVIHRMRADRTLEVIRVDLAGILKGTAADVTLRNEDVLFVPSLAESQQDQTYSIFGDVYEPGIYQFAYNTTVEDLVLQAGGLLKSASNQVKVSRRQNDRGAATAGNRVEHFTFTLKDGFVVDGEEGFVLEPFDEVYVLRSPSYSAPANVEVEGEICFPGTYSLNQNSRISDLLNMCGGLTAQAAKNGVFVMRKMNEDEERMRQMRLDEERTAHAYNIELRASQLQPGAKTLPISDSLLVEQYLREDYYKVAVDLPKVLAEPGSDEDLALQDGDRVIVNPYINTVKLAGNVPYQGAVPYVEGKTLKYYLRQGGVTSNRRNIKMSYVIGPNGQAFSGRRNMKIEPGSEVYLRQSTEALTTAQKISIFATVASTFATAAAVVISVVK